jgi:hypothetical protein
MDGKNPGLYLFWERAALMNTVQLILQIILQILRDPAWNAVDTFVALASVGLALWKTREPRPLHPPLLKGNPQRDQEGGGIKEEKKPSALVPLNTDTTRSVDTRYLTLRSHFLTTNGSLYSGILF